MRIFSKYFSVVLLWTLLGAGFSAFLFFTEINTLQRQYESDLLQQRGALALQLFEEGRAQVPNKKSSKTLLASIRRRVHSDIVLWEANGRVLSTFSPLEHNQIAARLRDANPDTNPFVLKLSRKELRFLFQKTPSGNTQIGVSTPVKNHSQALLTTFLLTVLLFLFFTGLGIYFISRSLLRPVREIGRALKDTESGRLKKIRASKASDEIAFLVSQFNRYADSLSEILDMQRERENGLSKQLQKNRIKLIKLTDNLERVVARRAAELREKDAQLLQTGKLAGLGELAAGIAHEINQPLNIIKLIVTGMMRQYSIKKTLDMEEVVKELNTINQQTIRVHKIIAHMKSFARKRNHITFTEIDINDPINDSMLLMGRQMEDHNIHLLLKLEENLPKINGDSIQVEQILVNLLNNARDAVESKETALQHEGHSEYEKKIAIHSFVKEKNVCVEVADNGSGMTEEISRKIFEPFFSTKGKKGTGLGMSITYNLVKNLNGEITVSSKRAEGTVFVISFPAAE